MSTPLDDPNGFHLNAGEVDVVLAQAERAVLEAEHAANTTKLSEATKDLTTAQENFLIYLHGMLDHILAHVCPNHDPLDHGCTPKEGKPDAS
jgi:hypothetical protein